MADTLEIVAGADGFWKLTLLDDQDSPITTYQGGASLSAACWAGADQAALFAPSVSWIDPSQGTIKLGVTASQSAALTTGLYDLLLTIVAGGVTAKRPIGILSVLPSPGSAIAKPVYQTWAETLLYAGSWAQKLQRADVDQTGFAAERARARTDFERALHNHYRGDSRYCRQSLSAFAERAISGAWYGYRDGRRTVELTEWLAANMLLVTDEIKECCACLALAMICERQIDPAKDNGYGAAAAHYASRADCLLGTIIAEIDTDGDGYGDVPIYLGSVDSIKG